MTILKYYILLSVGHLILVGLLVEPGRDGHQALGHATANVYLTAHVERLVQHGESLDQHLRAEIDVGHGVGDRVQEVGHLAGVDHFGGQLQGFHAHVRVHAGHRAVHLVDYVLESLHGVRAGEDGRDRVARLDLFVGSLTVVGNVDAPNDRGRRR